MEVQASAMLFLIVLPTERVFKELSPAERAGDAVFRGGCKGSVAFMVLLLIMHAIRPSPSANRFSYAVYNRSNICIDSALVFNLKMFCTAASRISLVRVHVYIYVCVSVKERQYRKIYVCPSVYMKSFAWLFALYVHISV